MRRTGGTRLVRFRWFYSGTCNLGQDLRCPCSPTSSALCLGCLAVVPCSVGWELAELSQAQ
jgi:hypothetical protein